MKIFSFFKRVFLLMLFAIVLLIIVSLVPLSFFEEDVQNEESDEVIPSLSLPLETTEQSKTYFNLFIEMDVSDLSESINELNHLVKEGSGVVVASSFSSPDSSLEGNTGSFIVEIDTQIVEQFLSDVKGLGKLQNLETYTNDEVLVMEDTQSWIENLTLQESKYQTLLSEETTISEIMKIEEELARIQSEIDKWSSLQAQDELARNKVTLHFNLDEQKSQEVTGWSEMIKSELSLQLDRMGQYAQWILVKLIGLTPYFLVFGILVGSVRLLFRRKKRRR